MNIYDKLEAAYGYRNRKVFKIIPVRCTDGKWRCMITLRVEEVKVGRRWYRVGALPALSP